MRPQETESESIADFHQVREDEIAVVAESIRAAGIKDEADLIQSLQAEAARGYCLYAVFKDGAMIAVAGARKMWSFTYGHHVIICDLVGMPGPETAPLTRELVTWIARKAKSRGIACVYLDRLTERSDQKPKQHQSL